MLGDTGAQGCVSPPSPHHKYGNGHGAVKMANGATAKIYQKDNFTIADEVSNDVFLVNRRAVDGITTPIISLTQLMTEGWKMKSGDSGNQRFIYMMKDGARLTFVEKRNNLYYLRAKITDEVVINNYTMQEPQKVHYYRW